MYGRFLAFEGIDGSGKSTQLGLLANRLKASGIPCYLTREPTDAPIGSLIHQIMTGRIHADDRVVAALFAADRLDHLTNGTDGILARLASGVTVLTDRYYFSSYAYHSVDMPMEWVIAANAQASGLLRPALTVFIDLPPEQAMERLAAGRGRLELYEKLERLTKVRQLYFNAFEHLKDEEEYVVFDGSLEPERLAEHIWARVAPLFGLA